jgi:hypothetical protein
VDEIEPSGTASTCPVISVNIVNSGDFDDPSSANYPARLLP